MTRRANARVAGYAFLLYIALGIASLMMSGAASQGEGTAAQLAAIARHEPQVRLAAVLTLICAFAAITLGVTLWAITREQDPDLATLGMVCRVAEGVVGGIAANTSIGLLWLGTHMGTDVIDREAAHALGAYFMGQRSVVVAGTFFAVGSTLFSWLMLRGRMVPAWLAGPGVFASALLVVTLPLGLAGVVTGMTAQVVWIPMALFEAVLAVWLIVKGIQAPRANPDLAPVS